MPNWLPSIPYPPSGQRGYWEPVTSTLNWCEEDYYATPYSAEIVNAFTNLLFMYLAYKGISNCITQKHDTVFLVSYAGYLVVGTGSFLFHSTLKYPWQLVDELSMIYTTCIMCYASFARNRGPLFSTILGLSLLGLSAFITIYYHYAKDPVFHQVSYGVLTAVLFFRSLWVMETGIRPKSNSQLSNGSANGSAHKSSDKEIEQNRQDDRDRAIVYTMWTMIPLGLGIFLGGFGIWILDNTYCSTLRTWRREIGLPWGILLEGHGWWHLMTGVGAYFYIVWGIWLRYCLNGQQDLVKLKWPSMFFSVPEIIKVDHPKSKANGHANGTANGHANGTANGHANGTANGHANGTANGHANGYANGHANGHANGYANGHANGSASKKTN